MKEFIFALNVFVLGLMASIANAEAKKVAGDVMGNDIRAAYLSVAHLEDKTARNHIKWLIKNTEINAVAIDCKESGLTPSDSRVQHVLWEFKEMGAYTICRFVVAQDNRFVAIYPGSAIRIGKGGPLWHSLPGLYWADMASPETFRYNLERAKEVVALGFDEINFDYIRFPTDGPKEKHFPFWENVSPRPSKCAVIESFLEKFTLELRRLKKPDGKTILISLDPFGYAFFGAEPGIGQCLLGMAKYVDVVMPMTYPSHYRCKAFGFPDPALHPREVVYQTLIKGLNILRNAGFDTVVRPWIQDFFFQNIYGCFDEKQAHRYVWKEDSQTGKKYFIVPYREKEVRAQIDAARKLGLNGYALWNISNDYTKEALTPKK